MKKYLVALAVLFGVPLVTATAHAEAPPSRWERAKDPEKMEDYRLHRSVQRMFPILDEMRRGRTELHSRIARDVVVSLDSWEAANSPDVRLRVDLGIALHEQGDYRRSVQVLKAAAAFAPDHPAMEDAWMTLGFSCGHIGDHECERNAYLKVLDLETEESARLTPTLNLAEVEMHGGNLKESIALYQETLRISYKLTASSSNALAEWGLAVAYDRAGDRNNAEKSAKRAIEISNSLRRDFLNDPSFVFFYPEYEVNYYEGMGAVALARGASSAHDSAIYWGLAERKFEQYVRRAEQTNPKDRFLGAAKARQTSCKAEREKAEKKRAKEPLKRTDEEELPL